MTRTERATLNGINSGTHRMTKSPEHRAWTALKQRCFNPRNPGYHYYGARGITVCDEWRASFEAFLRDIGPRPSAAHSIDRINTFGNYEPGNCRWATRLEQQANLRPRIACQEGHEFSPSNTLTKKDGTRLCVACKTLRDSIKNVNRMLRYYQSNSIAQSLGLPPANQGRV